MANLMQAYKQWATRPADERFWTVQDALVAANDYRDNAREREYRYDHLWVEPDGQDLTLVTRPGTPDGRPLQPARLTHWSCGQLCQRTGIPAGYLRTLPGDLAARNLNYGLTHRTTEDAVASLLLHDNGSHTLRAVTSDEYARIWNSDILTRCCNLVEERGWRVPPARPVRGLNDHLARPATEADVLRDQGFGLSVRVGDSIAPAGIYLSDHDTFVFLISEARVEDGTPGGLSRGVFITNSEVGASSLRITAFLLRHCCSNHIVWDASHVAELRLRHVGGVERRAWRAFEVELKRYIDRPASEDESRIRTAKAHLLGQTKEEVLDRIFGIARLSRKALLEAYETVNPDVDGDPRSAWGLAQGMTRFSQQTDYQDERDQIDRAAGRVLALAA